jgi:hypothetical protein
MFRSRSDIFRLRTDKFRLRNDFVSPGGSQAVEIIGARNVRFRSFVRFQGVTPAFFSRFLFRRPFSEPPVRPSLNLVSQNSSITRIRFQGKPKGESASVRIPLSPTQATRLARQECADLGRSAEGRRNSEADVQATGRIDCFRGQWTFALVVTPETMGGAKILGPFVITCD